jgi:hypothetical protein
MDADARKARRSTIFRDALRALGYRQPRAPSRRSRARGAARDEMERALKFDALRAISRRPTPAAGYP